MLVIFTPKEKVRQIIEERCGGVTYEDLGENETLGGIISTRDVILNVRSNGQTYEFGAYGRPILNEYQLEISEFSNSKPILEQERINRRKRYIRYAKINDLEVEDYTKTCGEFGGNPKVEPTTKQIRIIQTICGKCEIPIWICDTLEPILSWGQDKTGITGWLNKNYQKYLGLPLYKIPPINFKEIDISELPEYEQVLIKDDNLDGCKSLAEQNIILLQEACKRINLKPILIDQKKLREIGAYKRGTDVLLGNLENIERKYGSVFRVECSSCGKYVYNVSIKDGKVFGVCDGKVRKRRTRERILEDEIKFEGCGNKLEEDLDYLYTNAIISGKFLTPIYMSNSDVGIFFPNMEFPSERIATGILPSMVRITGEIFGSGVPEIIKVGDFRIDNQTENIFYVFGIMPADDFIKILGETPPYRRVDMKRKSLESLLIKKIKEFNPPTDSRLLADIIYSLKAKDIDLKRLNWNNQARQGYIKELLICLGNVRGNKVLLSRPRILWREDYETFMGNKYLTEEEIEDLKKNMVNPNSPIRTIMETNYLASLLTYD